MPRVTPNGKHRPIQDKVHGLIFSSDIYGCTRAGSADNVRCFRAEG